MRITNEPMPLLDAMMAANAKAGFGPAEAFAIHRTDRPATDLLLWLHNSMGAGPRGTGINRWHRGPPTGEVA